MTRTIATVGLIAAAAVIGSGCDSLWPLQGRYDPRRCDPACRDDQDCVEGVCRHRAADAALDAPRPDAAPDAPWPETAPDAAAPDAAAPDAAVPDLLPSDHSVLDALGAPGGWILLGQGSFSMGSPATEPCREPNAIKETLHGVTLSQGFYISETEVTQGQFKQVLGYNPSTYTTCGAACPVESVTWHEAVLYCNTLSTKAGLTPCFTCSTSGGTTCSVKAAYGGKAIYGCKGYRLPTEAEFEYAYRAGSTTALYPTASTNGAITSCVTADSAVDKIAWYKDNAGGISHPVKGKLPNAWGLYDMAGNVDEFCQDWYRQDLGSAALTDPFNAFDGNNVERIVRGGGWGSLSTYVRAASRWAEPMTKTLSGVGFRCVRSAP